MTIEEILMSVMSLGALLCFIKAGYMAYKDKKSGKCLWCRYERTGRGHSYKYKEDGVPRSEWFYEYRCKKCGEVKNFIG